MEFVHDWIHNPLATKTGKLSALERAKNLFLGSLRTGELKQKLQEIKDNPDLIQKTRIVGHEASVKLNEVVTQNRLTHLKLMLERGYDPCAKLELPSGNTIPESQDNWSIAHEAVMANSCDTLLHLIENGLELKKVQSNEGWTLTHAAAYSGSTAALKICLDHGCPADLPDLYKRTPLYWAMIAGRFFAVRLLIWHKADLTAQDQWRNTPLSWAQAHHTSQTGDYVLRAAAGEFDGMDEPEVDDANKLSQEEEDDADSDSSEVYQARTHNIMQKEKEEGSPMSPK
jgi:hypothetical protein